MAVVPDMDKVTPMVSRISSLLAPALTAACKCPRVTRGAVVLNPYGNGHQMFFFGAERPIAKCGSDGFQCEIPDFGLFLVEVLAAG